MHKHATAKTPEDEVDDLEDKDEAPPEVVPPAAPAEEPQKPDASGPWGRDA